MSTPQQVQRLPLSRLRLNDSNPRYIREEGFLKLVKSLKEFPQMMDLRPIVVSEDFTILGGNMRYQAAKKAGWKDIPVIIAQGLTPEQQREFIIKDNVAFGDWDWEALANEWNVDQLSDWGLDLPHFDDHAPTAEEPGDQLREDYSLKIGEVVYEPKETHHKPADLFTRDSRFDAEIDTIADPELREMLRARAAFFSTFNFSRIADYYAYQATPAEKQIFEKLALVLLDRDGLIENGFSEIIENVQQENGYSDDE